MRNLWIVQLRYAAAGKHKLTSPDLWPQDSTDLSPVDYQILELM